MEQKPNFWATLPGILTGLAAVITALTGLYLAVRDHAPSTTPPAAEAQPADPATSPQPIPPSTGVAGDALPISVVDAEVARPATAGTVGSLVDCSRPLFQLDNTVRSLMSWSDHYHEQIRAADGSAGQAAYPCQHALSYRGSAHCQRPDDLVIRQALFETLTLCSAAGIEVSDLPGK